MAVNCLQLYGDLLTLISKEWTNTITFIIISDTKTDLRLIIWAQTSLGLRLSVLIPSLLVPKVTQKGDDPHMRNRENISAFLLSLTNHLAGIGETFQHRVAINNF